VSGRCSRPVFPHEEQCLAQQGVRISDGEFVGDGHGIGSSGTMPYSSAARTSLRSTSLLALASHMRGDVAIGTIRSPSVEVARLVTSEVDDEPVF